MKNFGGIKFHVSLRICVLPELNLMEDPKNREIREI